MYYCTERNRITIAFFAGLPFNDDGLLITLCSEVSWWIPSSYLSHEQVALYSISFWDVPGGSASIWLHCMEKQSFSRNNQLKYKGNQQVPPHAGNCLPNYTVSTVILITSLRTWNLNSNTNSLKHYITGLFTWTFVHLQYWSFLCWHWRRACLPTCMIIWQL